MGLKREDFPDILRMFERGGLFRKRDSFAEYLTSTGRYDTEQDIVENFDSLVLDVRKWLKAKHYGHAEALLDLVLDKKDGLTRKDGKTPSALHEVTQAVWFISCVEDGLPVEDPAGVLSLIFSHDLGEDFGVTTQDLWHYLHVEKAFADDEQLQEIIDDYDVISKRWGKGGPERYANEYQYFHIAQHQRRNNSIAKLIDRAHNITTMIGVKDEEGEQEKAVMMKYIAKTLTLLGDYVRDASQVHPKQAETYEALQYVIDRVSQVSRYYVVDTGKVMVEDDELRSSMPDKGFLKLPNGFHPLIFAAERIRLTYPETHLAQKQDLNGVESSAVSGSVGSAGAGGDQDVAGDIPEVTK